MKCARCGDDMIRTYANQRRCDQCEREIALIDDRDNVRRRGRDFPTAKDTTDLALPL